MKNKIYSDNFKALVMKGIADNTYIGVGNPNAKILIVGKEGACETPPQGEICFARQWAQVIGNKEQINLRRPYNAENRLGEGETWSKYQKLHDHIFSNISGEREKFETNFEERVFTTEMNINRSKKTREASKEGIQERKESFFRSEFIAQFPVVILACGNYISNQGEGKDREIDNIFGVTFREEVVVQQTGKTKYSFWIHRNEDDSKLVIHTRQLSADVPNKLLEEMGATIKEFLKLS